MTLQLEQCFNVRDLGGLTTEDGDRVRHGRLLRADAPVLASAADVEVWRGLGVSAVVDLRTHRERELSHAAAWEALGLEPAHHPLVEVLPSDSDWPRYLDPGFCAALYLEMLEDGREGHAALWRALAGALPGQVVVHCASGRDRTGIVVALLLAGIGVRREEVVADYAASAPGMVRMLAHLDEHAPEVAPSQEQFRQAFVSTPAETMELFLDGVDERWGGAAGWFAEVGCTSELAAISDHLLARDAAV